MLSDVVRCGNQSYPVIVNVDQLAAWFSCDRRSDKLHSLGRRKFVPLFAIQLAKGNVTFSDEFPSQNARILQLLLP